MATKIKITKSGDPKKGTVTEEKATIKSRGPLEDTADIQDIISGMVGKGYTTLSDDDARGGFARMEALLGRDKARDLMTKIFIYNQRPENQRAPMEARISQFYDTAANDPVISKARNFGYGVLPGFRTSASALNQSLLGRIPASTEVAEVNPEIKRRIMLKINK